MDSQTKTLKHTTQTRNKLKRLVEDRELIHGMQGKTIAELVHDFANNPRGDIPNRPGVANSIGAQNKQKDQTIGSSNLAPTAILDNNQDFLSMLFLHCHL